MLFEASSINTVHKIKNIPVLVFYTENDPGPKVTEEMQAKLSQNDNILMAKTKYGGHLAYFESYFSI